MKIRMFFLIAVVLLIGSISMSPLTADAGGWHGGWGRGGTSWNFGINLGGWGYGWGAPYYPYYPYPYYPYPYYPNYPYYNNPPAVIQQQAPAYQQPAPSPEEQSYWYFCTNPQGYYPYIQRCPSGWLKVIPSSVQPPPLPPQAAEHKARVLDRLTIHVNFDFDKSNITKDDEADLKKAIDFISKYRGAKVELDGYTDDKGTKEYNLKLSEKRAEAVKQYLIKEGAVDKASITARGYGESRPIAPNKTKDGKDNPEGRAENRRVEILILAE